MNVVKVIKQIFKEFWLPFILALCWSFYSIGETFSLARFIANFGTAFFLISLACGQFFRIQKQNKVEDNFVDIRKNMEDFLKALENRTENIINTLTGGDSFCYWHIANINDNCGIETTVHKGKYTLFNVRVRIVDNEKMSLLPEHLKASIKGWDQCTYMRSFNSLLAKHVFGGNVFNLEEGDKRSFNIFWTASNGSFDQLLRYEKVDRQWFWATKVSRQGIILYEEIQEGYPKNENGSINW